MPPLSISALGFVAITACKNITLFAPYDLNPDTGLILTSEFLGITGVQRKSRNTQQELDSVTEFFKPC